MEIDPKDVAARFWSVWLELESQLYKCCLGILRNQAEAEDALGRARLKAWDKVQKYAGKVADLASWLKALTGNLCKDILKERRREAAGVEDIDLAGSRDCFVAASSVKTPEEFLENEEIWEQIARAVANLPEATRETYKLHYYQRLGNEEIAQKQGLSYSAVSQRISRAKRRLAEKLKDYFGGGIVGDALSEPVAREEESEQQLGDGEIEVAGEEPVPIAEESLNTFEPPSVSVSPLPVSDSPECSADNARGRFALVEVQEDERYEAAIIVARSPFIDSGRQCREISEINVAREAGNIWEEFCLGIARWQKGLTEKMGRYFREGLAGESAFKSTLGRAIDDGGTTAGLYMRSLG